MGKLVTFALIWFVVCGGIALGFVHHRNNVAPVVIVENDAAPEAVAPASTVETVKNEDRNMQDTDSGRTEDANYPHNQVFSKKLSVGFGPYSVSEYCYDGTVYIRYGDELTAKFKYDHTVACDDKK